MSQVREIEHKASIKFLTKKGLTPKIRLEVSLPIPTMIQRAKYVRMDQDSLEDDARPERPMEMKTKDKVTLMENLVLSQDQ